MAAVTSLSTPSPSSSSSSGSARADNRSELQIRAPDTRIGVLVRADGSVRYSQGHTSVIIAINGPLPVGRRDEKMDRATLEVIVKPSHGRADQHSDNERADIIRASLESMILLQQHPCTKIQIVIQTIRDDGALLATCINGACLALLDSGIQCNMMISAVTIAANYIDAIAPSSTTTSSSTAKDNITRGSGNGARVRYILDPIATEESGADALFTFAFSNTTITSTTTPFGSLVSPALSSSTTASSSTASPAASTVAGLIVSDTRGMMTDDIYNESLQLGQRTCRTIESIFRATLDKQYIPAPASS
jgi:exosome complex component RRP46